MNAPASTTPIRIDFVSDIVCPWCAVGLASLEQAIARVGEDAAVEIHVQPFELNPDMAPEGEAIDEHLARKYGMTPAQLEQNRERLRERGAEVGFEFALGARTRTYNTFDAHRLLHWASAEGRGLPLKHALLRAYFTDGDNVSDHATLVRLAGEVGLDTARAQAVLGSQEFADEVRADEQHVLQAGIHSVPAIIFDRQYLVSGGQPVEVFEQVLRQLVTQRHTA